MAELREVPCVVREVPDRAAMAIALIENIQREDLHTLEEARALERLKEEFSLTHQEVADAVGRSRVAVTNLLRLMELNQDVIALLEENRLEMGHARALLGLKGEDQSQAARQVVDRRLSVRQTEALVRKWSEHKPTERLSPRRPDPDIERLRADLSERLGTRVTIEDKGGRGRLTINYHSLDQLDGILSRIK
jgi:ParB family chromosome partitioning protein